MSSSPQDEIRAELKEHGQRLTTLEIAQAELNARLADLCKKIDQLTGWIKALVISLLTLLGSFVVWYLEKLATG